MGIEPLNETASSQARLYWACQVGGWGTYAAVGLWFATRTAGWRPALVAGYALYPAYSIALTDLLRRDMRRRYSFAEARSWRRFTIALSVLAVGIVQTFLIVAINVALEGRASPFVDLSQILYVGLGTTSATTLWMLYYQVLTTARRRRERQAELELALRDAELRSLEAQINPHFLFNCLNSIRGLIVESPLQAQDMITRLASLLRNSLHRGNHLVPLEAELDAIGDYLALESARFEDRLHVHRDIAPEATRALVPALLLQTLVENAVKHGIAPSPDGGAITIRASLETNVTVLEVENSGQWTAPSGRPGLGLVNARHRLHILFGDRATLDVRGVDGVRVLATVRIPVA